VKETSRIRSSAGQRGGLALLLAAATAAALAVGMLVAAPPSPVSGDHEKPQGPEFEVASVKVNKSGSPAVSFDVSPSGRITAINVSLQMMITLAYHVRPNMITGAPGWLDEDHYDFIAKARPKVSEDELRVMMQHLLRDRFKLAVHREDKEFPGYVLVKAKAGAKLSNPDANQHDEEGCTPQVKAGLPGDHHFACYMGMEKLAEALPVLAKGYIDRPVIDQTDLKGFYKFKLDWTGVVQWQAAGGPTVFDAVSDLGLKLESRKITLPGLVLEHVERVPTDN
jgi:uncharacterized protein (TIGR03435 family)